MNLYLKGKLQKLKITGLCNFSRYIKKEIVGFQKRLLFFSIIYVGEILPIQVVGNKTNDPKHMCLTESLLWLPRYQIHVP